MLTLQDLSPSTRVQAIERLTSPDLGRWLAQVQQVGRCTNPIRVVGSSETIDPATGRGAAQLLVGVGAGRDHLSPLREPASRGV